MFTYREGESETLLSAIKIKKQIELFGIHPSIYQRIKFTEHAWLDNEHQILCM